MAEIVLDGVCKTYAGDVRGVDRLDLAVRDGELLVLVGPSGCGKSTTLRLIAGLERPTAGELRIGGRVVGNLPPAKRNIAMVFQHHALFSHLTVAGNMAFGYRLRKGGWWRRLLAGKRAMTDGDEAALPEIDRRVHDAARRLGVEDQLARRPWQLSGGERQRVALGQAIVRRPAAFLFDEPLSHLDAPARRELKTELKALHHQLRTTTIYVTHDQSEALSLGDRVAVMEHGRLLQVGSPAELYARPRNRRVAALLGSPSMNFIRGTWDRGGSPWRFQADGWSADLSAETMDVESMDAVRRADVADVVIGIRPDAVEVGPVTTYSGGQSPAGSAAEARGRVALVEFMGDKSIVHVELPGRGSDAGIVVRGEAAGDCRLQPGDTAVARFALRRAVWFDHVTGDNLAWRAA